MADDLEASGEVIQHLADILADLAHSAATGGAGAIRNMDDLPARQVFGELKVEYLQAPFSMGQSIFAIRNPRTFAHVLHNTGFGDLQELETLIAAWRNMLKMVQPPAVNSLQT